MSLEDFNLHEWEKEKLDDMVNYNREQKAIEKGIKLTTKEMIKNGIDIETISKITKLSNEEIKKIEASITD